MFAKKLHNPVRVLKAIKERKIPIAEVLLSRWVGRTEQLFREEVDSLLKFHERAMVVDFAPHYASLAELKTGNIANPARHLFIEMRRAKESGCRVYLRFRNELRRVYWRRVK